MRFSYACFLKSLLLVIVVFSLTLVPEACLAKKKNKDVEAKATVVTKASTDEQAAAREHYSNGKTAYDSSDFSTALEEFQAAYDIKPHPTVLRSIAECMLQTGDIQGAIKNFEKYLDDPEASNKDEVKARLEEAQGMRGTVEITSTPAGAGILIDGSVSDKVTPVTIELIPGEHEITFNLDEQPPIVKSVEVKKSEVSLLNADFEVDAVNGRQLIDPFASEENDDEAKIEKESDGPPPAFWAAAAIAGVGLISGTIFGTMALGAEDDYKKDPTNLDTKDNGERSALISDISFGVALTSAIVGIVILVVNSSDKDESSAADSAATKITVAPMAGGNTVGVSTMITF